MSDVCTRSAMAGSLLGGACPACGHALLLHPSTANPGLDHCVICEVLEQVRPAP